MEFRTIDQLNQIHLHDKSTTNWIWASTHNSHIDIAFPIDLIYVNIRHLKFVMENCAKMTAHV